MNTKTTDTTKQDDDDDVLDVLIIGAGWAGLSAARHIYSHKKLSYRILEAREYVGGRSKTITIGENQVPIELGSEFIQGIENNPVFSMVQNSRMEYRFGSGEGGAWIATENDETPARRLTEEQMNQIEHQYWDGEGQFLTYQWRRQKLASPSSAATLRSIADDYIRKKKKRSKKFSDFHRRCFEHLLYGNVVTEYAADLEDISFKYWDAGKWTDGDDVYLATGGSNSGFSSLVDVYADPVIAQVQLNSAVRSINYSNSIILVRYEIIDKTNPNSNSIQHLKARNVLITVPLGVLQSNTLTFIPPLPASKQTAIHELGTGYLTKCFLLWEDEKDIFWPKELEWIGLIARDKTRQGKWTEFFNPYAMNGGCPMLVSYAAGSESKRVQTLTNDEIKHEVLTSLRCIFGNDIVPEPKEFIVTNWGDTDEYSKGAYSFYKVGSSPKSRVELGKCLEKKLYFAGEAVDLNNPSTVHGALASGEKSAREIVKRMMKLRKDRDN